MTEITRGSKNAYEDLVFPDAEEMKIKAQLVTKISDIVKSRKWTQRQAAEVLGMPQPKLCKMLNGQFRGISQSKLLEYLAKLGRDVKIVVSRPQRRKAPGKINVVFEASA